MQGEEVRKNFLKRITNTVKQIFLKPTKPCAKFKFIS